MAFKPYEAIDTITRCKAAEDLMLMLINASLDVVGDAKIKRTIFSIGKEIDVRGQTPFSLSFRGRPHGSALCAARGHASGGARNPETKTGDVAGFRVRRYAAPRNDALPLFLIPSKRHPFALGQPFQRREAGFVSHFRALGDPVAEIDIGQGVAPAFLDQPQDRPG